MLASGLNTINNFKFKPPHHHSVPFSFPLITLSSLHLLSKQLFFEKRVSAVHVNITSSNTHTVVKYNFLRGAAPLGLPFTAFRHFIERQIFFKRKANPNLKPCSNASVLSLSSLAAAAAFSLSAQKQRRQKPGTKNQNTVNEPRLWGRKIPKIGRAKGKPEGIRKGNCRTRCLRLQQRMIIFDKITRSWKQQTHATSLSSILLCLLPALD